MTEFNVNLNFDNLDNLSLEMSLLGLENNPQTKKNPLQISELLTAILNNLESIHELIQLRMVCAHWKSVIESICSHRVHCLLLFNFQQHINDKFLLERFFGESFKFECFVALKFRFDEQFYRFLGNIFPNVDQLVVRKTSLTPDNVHEMLEKYFPSVTTYSLGGQRSWSSRNRLINVASYQPIKWRLKRLDLDDNLTLVQSNGKLFDQLEHFSSFQYGNDCTIDALPPLGSKCTHFWFRCETLIASAFQRWIEHNCNSGSNLASVTHLGLSWVGNDILPLICTKFESLRMLDLGWDTSADGLFDRNACAQLAKLTHLRTLRIRRTTLDPTSLERVTVPLKSVRVLHLMDVDIMGVTTFTTRYGLSDAETFEQNGPIYCRILANIFLNLEELAIFTTKIYFRESFQNNLSHFTKLRHLIKFNTEFDI